MPRFVHIVQHMEKGIEKFSAAGVHHQYHAGDMARRMGAKLGEFRNEHRRQIVYAKEAKILQVAADFRLSAARHAGDDDETIGIVLLHAPPPKNVT